MKILVLSDFADNVSQERGLSAASMVHRLLDTAYSTRRASSLVRGGRGTMSSPNMLTPVHFIQIPKSLGAASSSIRMDLARQNGQVAFGISCTKDASENGK